MYHRQISKMDLSGSVMDLLLSNASIKFSPEELKDIFTFQDCDTSLTHDLLECDCDCDGANLELNSSFEELENIPPQKKKRKGMSAMGDLSKWEHFGPPFKNSSLNAGLLHSTSDIQFLFRSQSTNISLSPEPEIDI
jgi:DNA repair and recombination protein RAD54B